jgi:hypothetical protein
MHVAAATIRLSLATGIQLDDNYFSPTRMRSSRKLLVESSRDRSVSQKPRLGDLATPSGGMSPSLSRVVQNAQVWQDEHANLHLS